MKSKKSVVMVYGGGDDPEWHRNHELMTFKYLESKIRSEKLNPEADYDSERYIALLKEIAECECMQYQREALVKILENG